MRLIAASVEAITMVLDVMRGYISVAGGLTDISVQRAKQMAEMVLSRSTEAADRSSEQIQELAEDLVKQSQTNRDLLIGLIRTEVDRTVGRMGFVREEELAAVRNHVQRLEAQLKALQAGATEKGTQAARTLTGAAGAVASKVSAPKAADGAPSSAPAAAAPPARPGPISPRRPPHRNPRRPRRRLPRRRLWRRRPPRRRPRLPRRRPQPSRPRPRRPPPKKATAKKATAPAPQETAAAAEATAADAEPMGAGSDD